MKLRRRALALVLTIALACTVSVLAQKDKKQEEAQKKEIQGIVSTVDAVAAGQPAPNDMSLAWMREDVLKAQGSKEYVPFTVSLDPSKVPGGTVAFYWRVVSKTPAAPEAAPPPGQKKDDKKDKDKKKPEYAYEDISFIPVSGAGPARISRSFTVSAGSYDVFIVAKEPSPEKPPKNAPPPKMSVLKQTVTVPDYWNGELNTSSVIIAQRIDPLPAQFDLAAGHQLQSGQAVPLASFPEGQYRLEIKVTYKIANKTLVREVPFTVSPS